ncbi:MAG: GyrI-like domain-containing protein [Spirochaetaceae bacterium]|nr:GyrI-like domain-containing protein [Spirochaetaceae bacterium]
MSDKIDLKKGAYKALYNAKAEPAFVRVPELACFAVDGSGDPNESSRFRDCVEALYAASYALKYSLKRERGLDCTVMPPEGDWACADMSRFSLDRKGEWLWTILVVQPPEATEAEALAAIAMARAKKDAPSALAELRFEVAPAHEAAQLLHLGPYATEAPDIARLHAFIAASGRKLAGKHREIYLGDPRKAEPAKLKTILRQPVE